MCSFVAVNSIKALYLVYEHQTQDAKRIQIARLSLKSPLRQNSLLPRSTIILQLLLTLDGSEIVTLLLKSPQEHHKLLNDSAQNQF